MIKLKDILKEISLVTGTPLYRGQLQGRGYKTNKGAVFFSPSLNYAKLYGDVVYITEVPPNLFDIFNKKSDFNKLKSWLSKKIGEIDGEEITGSILSFYRDARKFVETNSPDELIRAMVNYGIVSSGGFESYVVGSIEKEFMEENGIAAMTIKETGTDKPEDEISVAFRGIPKMKKVDL